jgi:hypothetical protein
MRIAANVLITILALFSARHLLLVMASWLHLPQAPWPPGKTFMKVSWSALSFGRFTSCGGS